MNQYQNQVGKIFHIKEDRLRKLINDGDIKAVKCDASGKQLVNAFELNDKLSKLSEKWGVQHANNLRKKKGV